MLRFSRKLDYAILAVSHLFTEKSGGPVSARNLAERCRVPPAVLANILKELGRAEIVRSLRGVHGGYELTVEPHQLSVGRLVRLLEGPTRLVECVLLPGEKVDELSPCGLQSECSVQMPLRMLHGRIQQLLDEVTFADLAAAGAGAAATMSLDEFQLSEIKPTHDPA